MEWSSGYVTELGYTHGFYRELTPALLAFATATQRYVVPDVGRPFTYCELGAGQGFSACLLAAANPHGEFWATDFNPAHIATARALAEEAELPNIHFEEDSFADFLERDLPAFDFVVLHGVYSWIGPAVRREVVEFLRRKLRPGGVAYVSYNSLPGWAQVGPLRELMMLLAGGAPEGAGDGGLDKRIASAVAQTQRLQKLGARFFKSNPLATQHLARLGGKPVGYLAHEYFNRDWSLFYHGQVAAEMAEAKLTYVGSATLTDDLEWIVIGREGAKLLSGIDDRALRETVKDFFVNRAFRRDVFVKGPVATPKAKQGELLSAWRFALSKPRGQLSLEVPAFGTTVRLKAQVYEPVLERLEAGPATGRELLDDAAISAVGLRKLVTALRLLVGLNHVQPIAATEADPGPKTTAAAERFNRVVLDAARDSADRHALASPLTGGGILLDRVRQLFLLALAEGESDPAAFAWKLLSAQGQALIKEGKRLESEEENLTELRSRAATFVDEAVPILERLGVAVSAAPS